MPKMFSWTNFHISLLPPCHLKIWMAYLEYENNSIFSKNVCVCVCVRPMKVIELKNPQFPATYHTRKVPLNKGHKSVLWKAIFHGPSKRNKDTSQSSYQVSKLTDTVVKAGLSLPAFKSNNLDKQIISIICVSKTLQSITKILLKKSFFKTDV